MLNASTPRGTWGSLQDHWNTLAWAKWPTHQCRDSPETWQSLTWHAMTKGPSVGNRPIDGKLHRFPQSSWNNPHRYIHGFPDSSVGKESARNAGDPSLIPGSERSAGEGIGYPLQYSWASLVAQLVKNLPAMRETWVRCLGWEDLLEKGKAIHSSILAWRSPWTLQSMGSQRFGHDWATLIFTFICGRLISLAYEITQPIKTNHAIFWGLLSSEMAHSLWRVFLSKQIYFLSIAFYLSISVSDWILSMMRHKEPKLHYVLTLGMWSQFETVQVLTWVLAGLESWAMDSSPIWAVWFQYYKSNKYSAGPQLLESFTLHCSPSTQFPSSEEYISIFFGCPSNDKLFIFK